MSLDPSKSEPWPDPPIPDQDEEGFMRPPWAKYPNLRKGSAGWRMGQGEAYRDDFNTWWSRQPRNVRLALRSKYPEPAEWAGFWRLQSGA